MKWLALCSLTVLAACGADGEPVRPTVDAGVSISNSGIYPNVAVGVNQGPVSLRLGL